MSEERSGSSSESEEIIEDENNEEVIADPKVPIRQDEIEILEKYGDEKEIPVEHSKGAAKVQDLYKVKIFKVDRNSFETILEGREEKNASEAFYDSVSRKYLGLQPKDRKKVSLQKMLNENSSREVRGMEFRDNLTIGKEDLMSPTILELCKQVNANYMGKWHHKALVSDEHTYHRDNKFYYYMRMKLELTIEDRTCVMEFRNEKVGKNLAALQTKCYTEALEFGLMKMFNYYGLLGKGKLFKVRMDDAGGKGWFEKLLDSGHLIWGGIAFALLTLLLGTVFGCLTFGIGFVLCIPSPIGLVVSAYKRRGEG